MGILHPPKEKHEETGTSGDGATYVFIVRPIRVLDACAGEDGGRLVWKRRVVEVSCGGHDREETRDGIQRARL